MLTREKGTDILYLTRVKYFACHRFEGDCT